MEMGSGCSCKQHKVEPTWRDKWIVKNVFAELPLAGGFFQTASTDRATHMAGKHAFMLIGGTLIMMSNFMRISHDDATASTFSKMLLTMAVGMTSGAIAYNSLRSVINGAVQSCTPEDTPVMRRSLVQQ